MQHSNAKAVARARRASVTWGGRGAPRRHPSGRAPQVLEGLEPRRLFSTAVAADDPDPSLQVQDRLVSESVGQVIFEITAPAGDVPVTVNYSTDPGTAAAGADYTSVSGTLTFDADPTSPRTRTVTVPFVDDAFWEDSEWFYLTLSGATGAPLPGGGETYRATATIRDDDPRPALRVSDARMTEGDADDAEMAFVVSLSAALDRPVTVGYATADGTATAPSDYGAATGTLVFDPGETSRAVPVRVHGDTLDESNETLTLVLRNATLASIADAIGVGTIVEDDDRPPTANVTDVTPDPRSSPVDSMTVVFSEPVDGVDLSDLTLTRDGGPNLLTPGQSLAGSADGVTWTLGNLGALTRAAGRYTLTLGSAGAGVADRSGNFLAAGASDGWRTFATVADRRVFYNNSFFDGNDPAPGADDDAAIATDKRALRLGQSPSYANVTGYARGINGVMIDVSGLPTDRDPAADDFAFDLGNGGDAAAWSEAPAPTSVTVRRGAGAGGSDRVTLVFPDNAIRDTWLRVTVLATNRTGLAAPDVFYFGSLVGDAGDTAPRAGASYRLAVDARDLIGILRRAAAGPPASLVTDAADLNRDGHVNALDYALARARLRHSLAPPFAP